MNRPQIRLARRRLCLSLGLGLTAAFVPALAMASTDAWPTKPIRFIVPYAPGGLPDTVARVLSQQLTQRLGKPVVVDNRPGANGVVAAQALMTSPADGYTFLVTDGSMMSINPAIYKNLSYEPKRDFVPVSLAARSPLFLAVIEATEEAIYNSLFRATTISGRGRTVEALPMDRTFEILRKHGLITVAR